MYIFHVRLYQALTMLGGVMFSYVNILSRTKLIKMLRSKHPKLLKFRYHGYISPNNYLKKSVYTFASPHSSSLCAFSFKPIPKPTDY